MDEDVSAGSRSEFLARIQRFTDEMLDSLNEASQGNDADEKEARTLRSSLLKSLGIWETALQYAQRDHRLEEKLRQVGKQASQTKSVEA